MILRECVVSVEGKRKRLEDKEKRIITKALLHHSCQSFDFYIYNDGRGKEGNIHFRRYTC